MSEPEAPLVLVTGISGFIASWVAHGALKLGYRVRGTVRSLANEDKVKHLRDLCPGSRYQVELVEADLMNEESWIPAVVGCDYILHVASPFVIDEPKDPNELILPAINGTLNVLKAAAKLDKPPRRVVVTSSSAAILYGTDTHGKVYTDDDWTVVDSKQFPVSAYTKSKYLAERAAWDFVEKLPADKKFELCTVNPTLVQGPMLSGSQCSSAEIVKQIAMGLLPALPDLSMGVVSVLDVARAHLLAMTVPEAAGKRFMVTNDNYKFKDLSRIITKEFKPLGYCPTTFQAPNWVIHTLAFFGDRKAAGITSSIGHVHQMDPINAKTILKMELKSDPRVITQMVYAAIAAGLIPDKSKDKSITKNYVCPELDVSGIQTA